MTILMIRPVQFAYNAQTAVNNAFQRQGVEDTVVVQDSAVREFDAFVAKLRDNDIDVLVIPDTPIPHTPDSIFPNNWISFHHDGSVVLYPMFAPNRRLERKQSVFHAIESLFLIRRRIDYTKHEAEGRFLEGTGSFVLDRKNGIAYACRSPRTDESLFLEFCRQFNFKPVVFDAVDEKGRAIYHTNVMMCIADSYAVINLESIVESDRLSVIKTLNESGKSIIAINQAQMIDFAGNMLQVENKQGKSFLVMSSRAFHSLQLAQVRKLESFDPIIHSPLDTIEQYGGGSARCMMAEVYLPVNSNDQQQ
ncbi:citrulline utilization hydrolase CtlX [Parapedobacter pyrenivorans]|uniref:citrulline utilization hydrolase CtlX n=1 Tax=Parapedobacter pyrenivorans TaxID=1305674 RepID=UPI003342B390